MNGQVINSNEIEKGTSIQRNASFNVEEIKVRWKKAALENCPGVPCVVSPSFTCGTSTVSDIDNNPYNTVLIGTQCWTKENLKVTRYNDGTLIPDLTNFGWGAVIGARTENKEPGAPPSTSVSGYVGTFGYLYNWYAVNDSRKLCPDGWHVPTDAEWTNLIQFIDPTASATAPVQSTSAGTVLKSTVTNPSLGSGLGWNPATPTPSPGTNTKGFSGLPGGLRNSDASFDKIRDGAFFWSATGASGLAMLRILDYSNGSVKSGTGLWSFGLSVRCLRD